MSLVRFQDAMTRQHLPLMYRAAKVGKYVKKAYKHIKKYYKGSDKNHDTAVTTQYDTKMVYKKKRMPKYKKRRWVSFTKKVSAASDRLIGSRTVLFNSRIIVGEGLAAGQQAYGIVHLYGANGVNIPDKEDGARDLRQLYVNDPDVSLRSTFKFENAVVDITMQNLEDVGSLEVDVYKLTYGRSENPWSNLQQNLQIINVPIGGPNSIFLDNRGSTPFDMSEAIAAGKWRIHSKRKYILSPGQMCTYQHRDASNKYLKGWELDPNSPRGSTDFNNKYTTTFLVIARNADPNATVARLRIASTRTYRYKVLQLSVNQGKNNVLNA